MGLFGKIFGSSPEKPPSAPPPPRRGFLGGGRIPDEYGALLTEAMTQGGPFPKSMRLRAGMTDYDLYGSWQLVTWNSPEEYAAVKDQVTPLKQRAENVFKVCLSRAESLEVFSAAVISL